MATSRHPFRKATDGWSCSSFSTFRHRLKMTQHQCDAQTEPVFSALYCPHLQRSPFFLFTQSYHTGWINCFFQLFHIQHLSSKQTTTSSPWWGFYTLTSPGLQGFYSMVLVLSVWNWLSPFHKVLFCYWKSWNSCSLLCIICVCISFTTWLQIFHKNNEGNEQIFEIVTRQTFIIANPKYTFKLGSVSNTICYCIVFISMSVFYVNIYISLSKTKFNSIAFWTPQRREDGRAEIFLYYLNPHVIM